MKEKVVKQKTPYIGNLVYTFLFFAFLACPVLAHILQICHYLLPENNEQTYHLHGAWIWMI